MATQTLTKPGADARPATSVPIEALAGGRPTPLVILALDLGRTTGWALAAPDGGITSGTEAFRHDRWQGGGIKFLKFKRWLTELKGCAGGLDLIVFEEVRRHLGVDAAHSMGGWLAILTAWCEHHGIAYEGVPVGTIKRHIAGKGNADKAAVIAAVRKLGFAPADDNEADALALLHWALANRIRGDR
jgi:crossover junction endodeoxyribonuclease RuvC